jgi:hypothetical protein
MCTLQHDDNIPLLSGYLIYAMNAMTKLMLPDSHFEFLLNIFVVIISFMCLATNCVTTIDQSKRENKK